MLIISSPARILTSSMTLTRRHFLAIFILQLLLQQLFLFLFPLSLFLFALLLFFAHHGVSVLRMRGEWNRNDGRRDRLRSATSGLAVATGNGQRRQLDARLFHRHFTATSLRRRFRILYHI